MGWTAAAVGATAYSSYSSKRASDKAAKASKKAAATQAGYEQQALDYLKEREEIPQQFREEALQGLGGLYGLEGGTGSQQDLIDRAINSPLYKAMMGGREFGEEAILRNASMTGGFRSGNVQGNLYDYNTQLQNQALLQSYNQQLQGLTGLAGLPSNANQIATMTGNIGQTYAQGQVAAAQAQQAGTQQGIGNLMGLGSLGIAAYGAGMFSDRRLKKNIKLLCTHKGFNLYSFKWNSIAERLGLSGQTIGAMADEVYAKRKDCVIIKDGWLFVLYDKLGILPRVCIE